MTELQEAIYLYAREHLFPRFEAPNYETLTQARREAERLGKELRSLGEEPGRTGRRLWTELETQAAFTIFIALISPYNHIKFLGHILLRKAAIFAKLDKAVGKNRHNSKLLLTTTKRSYIIKIRPFGHKYPIRGGIKND